MPKTTDADLDLRRAILDTTRTLLVREGYSKLSMRRIARALGYSATSIYLYFENKDALFHALIDEGMERLYRVLKASQEGWTDPVERLRAVCARYVRFGLENPEYYELMFMPHPRHMERYPADKYRRARRNLDLVAGALADGAAAGAVVPGDARVQASTLWSALHGAVALVLAQRIDIRVDQEAFLEAAIAHAVGSFLVRS
ncbi:MAG: TetR/AcrR family transcriptional regulator [Bacteroidota bacterium]